MPCSGLGLGGDREWSRSPVIGIRIVWFEVKDGGDGQSAPIGKDKVGNWVRDT